MKKILALMSLVALLGLGMNDSNPTPDEAVVSPGIIVKGQITKTGACAELTTCVGFTRYNLINLPSSYTVGDEVVIKGQFVSGSTPCTSYYSVINVGRIRYEPC